jgi:hypothetical protein
LSGPRDVEKEEMDRVLSTQFDQRRNLLVNHLHLFRQKGEDPMEGRQGGPHIIKYKFHNILRNHN